MIKERGTTYSSAFPIRLAIIINVLQRETDTLVESLWVSYPVGNFSETYAVALSSNAVISDYFVGEALTGDIVPYIRLLLSSDPPVRNTHGAFVYTWFTKTCVRPSARSAFRSGARSCLTCISQVDI